MSRPSVLRALFGALLILAVCAPAASAEVGPDYVTSDNVQLLTRIKTPGDGVGARIVGRYMYVTTTKSLSIFDIAANPANPPQVGNDTMDVEFENEEVPTNGRWLGLSGQLGCADPGSANITNMSGHGSSGVGTESTGCLTAYDVSNPAAPKKITSIPGAGQHTTACLYDCTWLYGNTGAITDNRDPAKAHVVGDWREAMPGGKAYFKASCHHLREIQPGIILGSCQPIILMSVRPEDGASIMHPVILDTGSNTDNRFIHSGRWPNQGRDKFVLIGGETNGHPSCDDTAGAFTVWDASDVIDGNGGFRTGQQFHLLSEIRPQSGDYADGHSPYNALGCSVHWFEEHPTFKNGGLVALAEYENGTHFLQITPSGKIVDQGFFLPLGGSTSAPHWNPYDPSIVYSIDYARGVDVLKYTGSTYVPDDQGVVQQQPGATPGTADEGKGGSGGTGNEGGAGSSGGSGSGSASSTTAPCEEGAGFNSIGAKKSGRTVRFNAALREGKSFDVTLSQVSRGRTLLNKRVARYRARKAGFTFKRAGLTDGRYVARFVTTTKNGQHDVRLLALRRKGGRWLVIPPFAQGPCGVFTSYALSGPAFGGRHNTPLKISYRLRRGADSVKIEAFAGKRLIKRFVGGGLGGRTYRFKLSPKGLKPGTLVHVRATVSQGSPVPAQTIYSRRI